MAGRLEIETIQQGRYNYPEGDHAYRYGNGPFDQAMRRWKDELVRRTFSGENGIVLELGADAGGVMTELNNLGINGVQIDIAPRRLGGNKSRVSGGYVCARAQELPFRNGTVSGVCAYDIIEHLIPEDGIMMLGEIQRVLKPGGRVVLSTTNTDCLARRLRSIVEPSRRVARDDHANEMSFRELRRLFARSGFTELAVYGAGLFPGMYRFQWLMPLAALHSLDNRLGRGIPQVAPEIFIVGLKPES